MSHRRSGSLTSALAALLAGALFACICGLSAQAQESSPAPAAGKPPAASTALRLGIGDLIEISVYGVPELSTKARVGSNGDIYLPLIDYVHVDGLTPEETQKVIEKRLGDGGFVNNPHVALLVDEYPSQTVSVLGQVAHPGPYQVLGERRLYDLISAAGGLTDRAGKTVIITHRDQPDKPIKVVLPEGLADTAESNVTIQPGDTVVVQRAGIVYIVGDVSHPTGVVMDNDHLTVLQAIALAGGTNKTAKLNGTRILRHTPNGVVETPIQLKQILQAKKADQALFADDILFIPGSAGKAAAYRAADVMLQAGTVSLVALRP
jgi:polysaccharide export outer membrane protein